MTNTKDISLDEKIEALDVLLSSAGWNIVLMHIKERIDLMRSEIENSFQDNNFPLKKNLSEIKILKSILALPANLLQELEMKQEAEKEK